MMGMLGRYQIKRPLYPLLCLISSALMLIGGMMLAGRTFYPVFLVELILFYTVFGYGRAALRVVVIFIPVSIFFFLLSCVVNQNLHTAYSMAARVFMTGLCVVPALGMIQIRLIRNLNQIHCPKMLTLGMLIAVRFVPVVAAEVRQIREAMRTRGVRATLWNVRCFYRALLIPLVMRLISISDTLSMSLETRGFELEDSPYTIYETVNFTIKDGVYLAAMIVLIIANHILLV